MKGPAACHLQMVQEKKLYVYIKQINSKLDEVYIGVHCITISTFGRFENFQSRKLRQGRNS